MFSVLVFLDRFSLLSSSYLKLIFLPFSPLLLLSVASYLVLLALLSTSFSYLWQCGRYRCLMIVSKFFVFVVLCACRYMVTGISGKMLKQDRTRTSGQIGSVWGKQGLRMCLQTSGCFIKMLFVKDIEKFTGTPGHMCQLQSVSQTVLTSWFMTTMRCGITGATWH